MKSILANRQASSPLKTRFVASVENYVETTEEMPQEDNSANGALKTAFKRSARYNDKSTRVAAPKSSQAQ